MIQRCTNYALNRGNKKGKQDAKRKKSSKSDQGFLS